MMPQNYRTASLAEEGRYASDDGTLISDDRKVPEKADAQDQQLEYKGSDDPFGDESNSEVKYKVLEWW